jgi:excisionase family DNA binding protein
MDRETAESVAGVARLPRRAALLGLGPDRSGRSWSSRAVLIIFSLQRTQAVSLHAQSARAMIIMENSATEMIFTPRWYTVAQVAQLLNYGESKIRMLIITGQLRSIKDRRSRRILQSGLRPTFKIAPRLPRTSGDESQSQRRRFDLSLPQWVHCLCLDYDSVREASAQVRLPTNTGDSPQPVDTAHAESRTRAGSHKVPTVGQFLNRWLEDTVAPNLAPLTYPTYESHVKNYIEPGLGALRLDRLRVADVQAWLNCLATQCQCCAQGKDARRALRGTARCCAVGQCCHRVASPRTIKDVRTVLRSGLNSAVRQELLDRKCGSARTDSEAAKARASAVDERRS